MGEEKGLHVLNDRNFGSGFNVRQKILLLLIGVLLWGNGFSGCHGGKTDSRPAKAVSFRGENTKVSEFLNVVSHQTGMEFVFNDSLIQDQTISCQFSEASLNEVLELLKDSLHIQVDLFNDRIAILKTIEPAG